MSSLTDQIMSDNKQEVDEDELEDKKDFEEEKSTVTVEL